ncbi:MAG: DEAD/DEAH box helicase [Alphaproteobacteria bacterium]|nr:DEAD/DEAH box helicase [Alphaproteobacteria bacterium]
MSTAVQHQPGDLVRCRGREWIVLPGAGGDLLRLRPLSGAESDTQVIDRSIEAEPVVSATFAPPDPDRTGPQEAALLLRDALRLSLRRGAGPFRSAGRIAFAPRAYQLVPLLMALKLETMRLLIADDVGIGKTIEAGLIARELMDRGEVTAMAVLCPPHLVDQWCVELTEKFHIQAVAVTASSAGKLERELPQTESIFSAYPITVVSLDYIKSDRRRNDFLRACPDFVIVDEAHACVGAGRGHHQRYQLLHELAANRERHLILLTATPHSGDDEAFYRLLGLIDPGFEGIEVETGTVRETMRRRLAAHFVQRRRIDIDTWNEPGVFPKREKMSEPTYRLTGEHLAFFDAVLDYCANVTTTAGTDERSRRLAFWSTLALMRCVGSSPAAALRTLRKRALGDDADVEALAERVLDGDTGEAGDDDTEPGADIGDPALAKLIGQAEALTLRPERDPKFIRLRGVVKELTEAGFSPVIFCRFIATAGAVGEALKRAFPSHTVAVVTGELPGDDRKARVEALTTADHRILVATDCLSEGINLQNLFDAVVHYDLSWNPTRHQQREGRVDRFGQPSLVIRTVLIYGENNAVDGAVLEVILRKAERIRRETGVPMPLPDADGKLTEALMKAVLLRHNDHDRRQLTLDFDTLPESKAMDKAWRDAAEGEKRSRTVFAQAAIKPAEVLPEWQKTLKVLGNGSETRRFLERAMRRLRAPLEPTRHGFKASLHLLPPALRERLAGEGLEDSLRFTFESTAKPCHIALHRSHPLVGIVAETMLEFALDGEADPNDPATLPRTGVWASEAVETVTTVALLRVRHRLEVTRREGKRLLLAEEATAIAWSGQPFTRTAEDEAAMALLDAPSKPVADTVRDRMLASALTRLDEVGSDIAAYATARAAVLAEDHGRIRRAAETEAARLRGTVTVTPVLPADVVGLYVLMPVL